MFAFQNVLSLSSLVAANDCHKKKTGVPHAMASKR